MKKIVAFIVFVSVLLSFSAVALAANESENQDTQQLAYLDYDSASDEMKAKILEARKEIIFSTDWIADGYSGCVRNVETGEIIRTLPSFSDLFPTWELPVEDCSGLTSNPSGVNLNSNSRSINDLDSWIQLLNAAYYLPAAGNTNTSPFVTFVVDPYDMGTHIRTYASSLTSSETCNIGYSNASTGVSLGYVTNLSLYQAVEVANVGNVNLAIRASTYSTPGWSVMTVEGAYRVIDVK